MNFCCVRPKKLDRSDLSLMSQSDHHGSEPITEEQISDPDHLNSCDQNTFCTLLRFKTTNILCMSLKLSCITFSTGDKLMLTTGGHVTGLFDSSKVCVSNLKGVRHDSASSAGVLIGDRLP